MGIVAYWFVEATWRAIGDLLDAFTPGECASHIVKSGNVSIHRHHAPAGGNFRVGTVPVIDIEPYAEWFVK